MPREQVTQNDIDNRAARTFADWKEAGRVVVRGQKAKQAPDGTLVFTLGQTTINDPFRLSKRDRNDGYEGREHGDIMDGPGNPCDYGDA